MNSIILSVGDELVLGQTVDTNSAWLSQQLAAIGCDVVAHMTVADDQSRIERALADCAGQCDFLIVSGGLGPTPDDLTRQALAALLNQPLEPNAHWMARLEEMFRRWGRPMPQANRIQAMIPRGATMIENTAGTAPGIDAAYRTSGGHSCRIFVMPGVPKEMKIMFARDVVGPVAASAAGALIVSRTLHTFGLGESLVAQRLGELMDRKRNPSVGTTVSQGVVSLRLNSRCATRDEALAQLQATETACRAALGDLIYGREEQTLASAVAELLVGRSATVATAESCTAGLLAKMLTDISGSSRYFQRGWITYSDQAKQEMLGVPQDLLANHGAVSEVVVSAMAESARKKAGADLALAISGIAGPEGGTPEKPVGTVCIALCHEGGTVARTFHFPGDRDWIRDRAAKMALTMLRYYLLGREMPF